jgi:hypothetical protein
MGFTLVAAKNMQIYLYVKSISAEGQRSGQFLEKFSGRGKSAGHETLKPKDLGHEIHCPLDDR